MKLSFKTILPIFLIFTLLILLAGCFITPSDEQPGYTPGTITGIIAAPCCSTSDDTVTEPCCISPEYWCYYCQKIWKLQDGIEVVLTYGKDEVATTTTNDKGEFTFTNVDPGKNYVITAYCPDFADNRPLVKDVALELIEGGSFDTKITDLVSTSLGLVVDFLVLYTDWGPEDISLVAVLADRPSFPNFPKFKKLVYEVRRVLESCGNVNTDKDVQVALCLAAEEISKLDIGCAPGVTPLPGPGPTPDPCEGHTAPYNILLDPLVATAGQPYSGTVSADDNDGDILTFTLTVGPEGMTLDPVTGEITWTPGCDDVCVCPSLEKIGKTKGEVTQLPPCNPIKVTVSDSCGSGDETFCIEVIPNLPPSFKNTPLNPESAICGEVYSFDASATDLDSSTLNYAKGTYTVGEWPDWLSLDTSTGLISGTAPCCIDPPCSFDVIVDVSDECSTVTQNITIEVTCEPEEVALDDFRVAFEDLPWGNWSGGTCEGSNDFDYNDCVSNVNVVGEFICGDYLKEIKFTVTYKFDGSGYLDHKFGLKMPDDFAGKPCIYNLNGAGFTSELNCPEEFIFFDKLSATPVESFDLTIEFTTPFEYDYAGFTLSDIHGDLMDVKPFIDISESGSPVERLIAGGPNTVLDDDKRVLLVPNTWQWPGEGIPIWKVYDEVSRDVCYPRFDSPGTWTWTP